jgi:hypothetical protein
VPTTYQHTTFAQAKARLASLLGDASKVFYVDEELGFYIREALRFWGLASHYFKDSGRFTTVAGQAFYDIGTITDSGGVALQSLTVTDRELINDALYQLMEPPITNWPGGYLGSEMFTLDEISDLLGKARDDELRQSGVIVTEVPYALNPGISRTDLNQSTIHINRCSVQEQGSSGPLPMWAIDYFQAQSSVDSISDNTPGRPKAFITNYTPTLAVDLYPPPQVGGTLRVYSVQSLAALTPTTAASIMGLPDDAAWIARYLLMSDLLGADGLARASQMSQYCMQRAEQGLDMLSTYQSLLWATLAGKRMTIASLGQLDAQRPDWQRSSGVPKSLHQLSWNLFAAYPVPNGAYTIEVEIVKKAPIPLTDSDFIQVGREHMDRIYDYAQHIACFKLQGREFQETLPLLQETTTMALEHQASVAGSAINYAFQARQAQSDRLMRPYQRRETLEQVQTAKEKL